MGTKSHKDRAPKNLRVGILSVSSTRSLKDDTSGHWIRHRAEKEGHQAVFHQVIPDDRAIIGRTVMECIAESRPDALLITGGSGISPKDVTIEAVEPLLDKVLTAFGPLFAQLSYEEIDSAALLSRATAGVVGRTLVFCVPGSLKACKLACKALIFPELGHMAAHLVE
ncbi:MAG: molybdenum cofactor biosynthesis protein MoaB [Desulfobacterales bacterium]|nr:molybdenum cofactor biosynthesis protein MoaB [Desulfobacterales bacterium]